MTVAQWIQWWNYETRDRIIAERVYCVHSNCRRLPLFVNMETGEGQIECPDHGPYWIMTPREPRPVKDAAPAA